MFRADTRWGSGARRLVATLGLVLFYGAAGAVSPARADSINGGGNFSYDPQAAHSSISVSASSAPGSTDAVGTAHLTLHSLSGKVIIVADVIHLSVEPLLGGQAWGALMAIRIRSSSDPDFVGAVEAVGVVTGLDGASEFNLLGGYTGRGHFRLVDDD